jgi:capsular polysaccharide biosynthesis protein
MQGILPSSTCSREQPYLGHPTHWLGYLTLSDDVVRLSMIGQTLRRQWRLLLAFAVLGAVVGAVASLLWPPAYESSSRVLVQGDPSKERMLSEAQIATSVVVLDRAASGLNWHVDGAGLRDSVTAAVTEGTVIEIKLRADSPERARQLAEGVTQQYVAFSTEILTRSANASGEVLGPRKASLQKQVLDMNRRISELQRTVGLLTADNAQGVAARAEQQQLINSRTDTVKELADLEGRIAKTQAEAAVSRESFSIIEPPLAPSAPVTLTRLQLVASGAALSAALGAFVAVAVRRADRRLRRGSDIAAALGAPVLGTVDAPDEMAVTSPANGAANGHHAHGRRSLLQRLLRNDAQWDVQPIIAGHDQALEHLRYRRVLARLWAAPEKSVRLLLIVVDDDVLASRAVGRLALAAAVDDRPVSVTTSSPELAETIGAFLADSGQGATTVNVEISTSVDHAHSAHAAVLSVVRVSAVRPTVPDCQHASAALVVVTSGTRTAWELLAVAEACHDAGHHIAGALMVLPLVEDGDAENAHPEPPRLSAAVGPPHGRAGRDPA